MTETELRTAYTRATGRDSSTCAVLRLVGGAGNRVYWRLAEAGHGASAVVMELPPEPGKSEEVSKDAAPAELPFLNVARYLAGLGVRVPHVLLDESHGKPPLLVIEDLTDQTLELALANPAAGGYEAVYAAAIRQLALLRARAEQAPDPKCLAYTRAFDFDLYQWEFEHFIEWGLLGRGAKPSAAELGELRRVFTQVSEQLAAAPRGFTHRDYQSRNIMVVPSSEQKAGGFEQVVIDFQDALQGPRQYDLVALLRDSYVELDRPLVEKMLRLWLERFAAEGGPVLDEARFIGFFDLLTVQRKLKDAGRFVFIDQVKKNPSYLAHIPASLRYVKAALARRPELSVAAEILARHVPELS
jgi:aminoglycoside/choline kinase family phosphotransferase